MERDALPPRAGIGSAQMVDARPLLHRGDDRGRRVGAEPAHAHLAAAVHEAPHRFGRREEERRFAIARDVRDRRRPLSLIGIEAGRRGIDSGRATGLTPRRCGVSSVATDRAAGTSPRCAAAIRSAVSPAEKPQPVSPISSGHQCDRAVRGRSGRRSGG
jgi:hypothetical protein